jgi:hypothetical protein
VQVERPGVFFEAVRQDRERELLRPQPVLDPCAW